jgi:hypothetical protein
VDEQPELWTVEALKALKVAHEETMTASTADARGDGMRFDIPGAVELRPVITGRQLLDIIGPAFAYVFDDDPMRPTLSVGRQRPSLAQPTPTTSTRSTR